jgi:hypothetical protein
MNDVTHYVNVIEEFEEYSVNGCQIDDSYCRRTFVKKTEAVLPVFSEAQFFRPLLNLVSEMAPRWPLRFQTQEKRTNYEETHFTFS